MMLNKRVLDKSSPRVALVGKPNVGKSSLFNKFTRSKAALVAESPELTRDRRYAEADLGRCKPTLIDTGGIASRLEDPLSEGVRAQTEAAIKEAEVLVLIFDGLQGLTPDDIEILDMARRSKKPFITVVNKIDSKEKRLRLSEFYETGLEELIDISVKTGRGLGVLKEKICSLIDDHFLKEKESEAVQQVNSEKRGLEDGSHFGVPSSEGFSLPLRVSIIGRPNVGKSSILNRILGEPRMLVSNIPGTTREAIDCLVERPGFRPLIFVDTAGIRKKSRVKDKIEKFSAIKSLDSIKDSDICVCIFDASEGITDQDKRLVGYSARYGKGCITVFNKWDMVRNDPKRRRLLNDEAKLLRNMIPYAPHLNISALTGKNVEKIFPLIQKVSRDYTYKETTGKLNRLLKEALLRRNPPVTKGHYLKLFYVTQTGTSPPAFTFFANYPALFPEHFRRYLSNFFRRELDIPNTPIKIILRKR